eukprot:EST43870.1 Hypothetical protein SS50377_16170 [Spironucleus salmonicida]
MVHQSRNITFNPQIKQAQEQSFLTPELYYNTKPKLYCYFQLKNGEIASRDSKEINFSQQETFQFQLNQIVFTIDLGEMIPLKNPMQIAKLSMKQLNLEYFSQNFGPIFQELRLIFRIGNYLNSGILSNSDQELIVYTIDNVQPSIEIQGCLDNTWVNLVILTLDKQSVPATYQFDQLLQCTQFTKNQIRAIDNLKSIKIDEPDKEMMLSNYIGNHQHKISYKYKTAEKVINALLKKFEKENKGLNFDYQKISEQPLQTKVSFTLQISLPFLDKEINNYKQMNVIYSEKDNTIQKKKDVLTHCLKYVNKDYLKNAFALAVFVSDDQLIKMIPQSQARPVSLQGTDGNYIISFKSAETFMSGSQASGNSIEAPLNLFGTVFASPLYFPDNKVESTISNEILQVISNNKTYIKSYSTILDIIQERKEECIIQLLASDRSTLNMQIKYLGEIKIKKKTQQEDKIQEQIQIQQRPKQAAPPFISTVLPKQQFIESIQTDNGMKTLAVDEEDVIPKQFIIDSQKIVYLEQQLLEKTKENIYLLKENETLKSTQNQLFNQEVDRDKSDPIFFERQSETISISDLNIAQYYTGLDLIPREISSKQQLMHYLANTCSTKRLTYAISNLCNEITLISKDASRVKAKNQENEDALINEQEQIIQHMEKKIYQFSQLIQQLQEQQYNIETLGQYSNVHALKCPERKVNSQRGNFPPTVLPPLSKPAINDITSVDDDIQKALSLAKQIKMQQ